MDGAGRSSPKQCAAMRRDGQPCTAPVPPDRAYCFAHDPDRATERQAAREKGGRGHGTAARAGKLVPALLRPVLDTLLDAVEGVKAGTTSPQQASALSSLAGAIVKVYQAGTLEERLTALEAAQTAEGGKAA